MGKQALMGESRRDSVASAFGGLGILHHELPSCHQPLLSTPSRELRVRSALLFAAPSTWPSCCLIIHDLDVRVAASASPGSRRQQSGALRHPDPTRWATAGHHVAKVYHALMPWPLPHGGLTKLQGDRRRDHTSQRSLIASARH